MSSATDNPAEVLQTLDAALDHEVSLVIYGRGALCLGFERPRAEFLTTQDWTASSGRVSSTNW
jgi:hypothetical protein|uniref:hypothetical protein n=1 Tax=Prosthecobacter sp. TaxID=1965333 RepID=UPI0037853105